MSFTACGADGIQETREHQASDNLPVSSKEENERMAEKDPGTESETNTGGNTMIEYDFSVFTNVVLFCIYLSYMDEYQIEVLYQHAKYCQAMTDADTDTMRELVSEDMVFTHMSGRQQTREEYFADVEDGSLRYFTIGIDSPVVEVDGDMASITYTSVLNANAYGARGTYRMNGTHWFEKRDGNWISINDPNG